MDFADVGHGGNRQGFEGFLSALDKVPGVAREQTAKDDRRRIEGVGDVRQADAEVVSGIAEDVQRALVAGVRQSGEFGN